MSVTMTTPASTLRLTPLRVTDLLQGLKAIVMIIMIMTKSLGARWASTSSWQPFGPAFAALQAGFCGPMGRLL